MGEFTGKQMGKHGRWHGEEGEVVVPGLCTLACHVTWLKSHDTTHWASLGHMGDGLDVWGMGTHGSWICEVGKRSQMGRGQANRQMVREQRQVGDSKGGAATNGLPPPHCITHCRLTCHLVMMWTMSVVPEWWWWVLGGVTLCVWRFVTTDM